MKNALLIVASILIVWFVWNLVKGIAASLLGVAFQVILIGIFCYAVYLVYKALNRQKIV